MDRRPLAERGMKFVPSLSGWSLMLAVASMPAAAAPVYSDGNPGSSVQVPSSPPGPRRGADVPAPQRAAGEAGRGHMSVDERRQLRRDIRDAGKDIYRSARQGRGDPRRSER